MNDTERQDDPEIQTVGCVKMPPGRCRRCTRIIGEKEEYCTDCVEYLGQLYQPRKGSQ